MGASKTVSWWQISAASTLAPPWRSSSSCPVQLTKSLGVQEHCHGNMERDNIPSIYCSSVRERAMPHCTVGKPRSLKGTAPHKKG